MRILLRALRRGCLTLVSRPVYLMMIVVIPVAMTLFFVSLMDEGLPLRTPTAVVDMDHSAMSRGIIRSLNASPAIDVQVEAESYRDALDKVRTGEVFGFFLIPEGFERDAVAGDSPMLSYYSNLAFFVPGTIAYKGFKTVAVSTAGGIVTTTIASTGLSDVLNPGSLIQPVAVQQHPVGNPWLNYSIYLCNSFVPGIIALLVMMMTVFSVCTEIKHATSPQWLAASGHSMVTALVGKLAPQTLIFTVVGLLMQAVFYRFNNFPLNGPAWHMALAMLLMVAACQGFALAIVELVPNLRLALSAVSLIGILSFSITGFSFPVQSMYGAVGIFSYIIPLRYYFLIYVDQALNGIPLYYSRWFYIALLAFVLLPFVGLRRLRRHCENPVYIP